MDEDFKSQDGSGMTQRIQGHRKGFYLSAQLSERKSAFSRKEKNTASTLTPICPTGAEAIPFACGFQGAAKFILHSALFLPECCRPQGKGALTSPEHLAPVPGTSPRPFLNTMLVNLHNKWEVALLSRGADRETGPRGFIHCPG